MTPTTSAQSSTGDTSTDGTEPGGAGLTDGERTAIRNAVREWVGMPLLSIGEGA